VWTRRGVLGLGAFAALPALPACRKRDRTSVLEALAREVVGGMARDLRADSAGLHARLQALDERPGVDQLQAARAALKQAIVAWRRAYAFRDGPFVSSNAFQRATFWPARPPAIRAVLAAGTPIDASLVAGLGLDAKGLFAAEYLLFDAQLGPLASAAGGAGDRQRRYARQLAANVLGYADRIARILGDGRAFAARFAGAGQASVNQLVAQAMDTLDMVLGKFDRVERVARGQHPAPLAAEGYFSGTSLDIAGALLAGTQQLYLGAAGGGLSDLVAAVSAPIDAHLKALLADCRARLAALDKPLEIALQSDPQGWAEAVAALQALRHFQKVELASALEC
jgi:predicted lipoprotein